MRHRVTPEEQALEELRRLKGQPVPHRERETRRSRYIAAVLLAVLCVAGVELAACHFFNPVLYEDLTGPARERIEAAWDGARGAGAFLIKSTGDRLSAAKDFFSDWMEEFTTPPPEEDSSLAQPELSPPKEILDPIITDIVERDGVEYLTGGGVEVVYYNQTDESRTEQRYGTDPLSTHGCGPTAMAMAVSSLTGESVDPADMAQLCVERGYWCKRHGSYLSIVQGVAEHYGLECEPVDLTDLDEDDLYLRLSTGDIIVALMTKGHFTKGGHFILLRGTTLSGEILVADPASRDRTLIPWDLSLILDELSPSRHDGAPLWILSKPINDTFS